jgi:hypothetical protein
MPNICPKIQVIHRVTGALSSDRLPIHPSNVIIANIENIIANTPDAVSIRLLAFHAIDHACYGEGYLIAFLPRSKTEAELKLLADELKSTILWLSLSNKIFLVVFRYGKPVQSSDNLKHWQDELQKAIKKSGIHNYSIVPQIKFIRDDNKKNLTVSDSTANAINVS